MLDIVILPHFFHLKNMLPDNLYKICVRILTFLLVFPTSVLLTSSNFTSDFQSRRIIGENACYTRLECKKAYSNTPIVYSKWPPKWTEEQDFWAKLGFREWMITIVKTCKWHKHKPNQKLLRCILLCKKSYKNPVTVLKYLFSKNVKNRYFVAIFVNIVFPVLRKFPPNVYMFSQFQWPNIQ